MRRLGLNQGETEEACPESVAFQIWPRIEEEAEEIFRDGADKTWRLM